MAYMVEQGQRCAMCGTADWEWEENKRAYTPVEKFCKGCYYKSVASEEAGRDMPGTSIVLVSSTSREAAQRLVAQRKAYEHDRS